MAGAVQNVGESILLQLQCVYIVAAIIMLCQQLIHLLKENGGVITTLRMNFSKENFYSVGSRAAGEGVTRVVNEDAVRSIALWVFTEDGTTLLARYFKTYDSPSVGALSVDIPVNLSSPNIQVYVIANADNSAISGLNTITGIINRVS